MHPQYWGNPLTMLNALAAFEYVHGYYLVPNEQRPLPTARCRTATTTQSLAAAIAGCAAPDSQPTGTRRSC